MKKARAALSPAEVDALAVRWERLNTVGGDAGQVERFLRDVGRLIETCRQLRTQPELFPALAGDAEGGGA